MDPRYIHLEPRGIEKRIYRVTTVERLFEWFETGQNVLVRPALWDDPFENFVLSARATIPSGETVRFGYKDQLYGQCWTLHDETDAMWRIYAPDKNGVRVQSTIAQLVGALYTAREVQHPAISCFIGRVDYERQDRLLKRLSDVANLEATAFDSSGREQAKSLLFKRWAFRHEREVRLIYFNPQASADLGNLFRYTVDPQSVTADIMFDPRMSKTLVAIYADRLRQVGFHGKVRQSTLYEVPDLEGELRG